MLLNCCSPSLRRCEKCRNMTCLEINVYLSIYLYTYIYIYIYILIDCGMVDCRIVLSFNPSRDHFQISSPSWISCKLRAGFEPAQNLSSGVVEWSFAVVITITPRPHLITFCCMFWSYYTNNRINWDGNKWTS